MVLAFKERFAPLVLDGNKIHTIREDRAGRWREGCKIHGATGVRTKNYFCFFETLCTGVQSIRIRYHGRGIKFKGKTIRIPEIYIDNKKIDFFWMNILAMNDGFELVEIGMPHWVGLTQFFSCDFDGKIIHWTEWRYGKMGYAAKVTDDTVMPFGEHKDLPLGQLPSSYLLWLYEQDWFKTKYYNIFCYIEDNIEFIEMRANG